MTVAPRHEALCGTACAIRYMMKRPSVPHVPGICRTGGPWLERLLNTTALFKESAPFVFFNVGANKGYAVAQTLQTLASAKFTNRDWQEAMWDHLKERRLYNQFSEGRSCGPCKLCRTNVTRLGSLHVESHAFEMMPEIYTWLQWAFAKFQIAGAVTHAAVTNASGTAINFVTVADHAQQFGWESSRTIHASESAEQMRNKRHSSGRSQVTISVPSLSLDDYMRQKQIGHVHYMQVDVEMQEANVLRGLRHTLSRRAVDVIELELGGSGWEGADVNATLHWLSRKSYSCLWQSAECLVPYSGPCYVDFRDLKGGNIVCAHGEALDGLRRSICKPNCVREST